MINGIQREGSGLARCIFQGRGGGGGGGIGSDAKDVGLGLIGGQEGRGVIVIDGMQGGGSGIGTFIAVAKEGVSVREA